MAKLTLQDFFLNPGRFTFNFWKIALPGIIGVSLDSNRIILIKNDTTSKYELAKKRYFTNSEKYEDIINRICSIFPNKSIFRYQLYVIVPESITQTDSDDLKRRINKKKYFSKTLFFTNSICVISNYDINSKSIYIYKISQKHYGFIGFYGSPISVTMELDNITNIDLCINNILNKEEKIIPKHLVNAIDDNGKKLIDIWENASIENIYISSDELIDYSTSTYNEIIKKVFIPDILLNGLYEYYKYMESLRVQYIG